MTVELKNGEDASDCQVVLRNGAYSLHAPSASEVTAGTHSDSKINPLRQRQGGGIVDGVGRPPHVRLPCIRAAFAAAAGFLFPAERAADLRAARADVDVGDAAVAAGGTEEALGLTD